MNESDAGKQGSARSAEIQTPKAVSMLKDDHKKVIDLFEQFERIDDKGIQREIAGRAIGELKIHSTIEEELFYPSVRKIVLDEDLMNEAAEEHHVVNMLIDEIDTQELEAEVFHAKFTVLAESVRHHIKHEEARMFPQLGQRGADLEELGCWMEERKQELEQSERVSRECADKFSKASFKLTPLHRPRRSNSKLRALERSD